MVSHGRSPFGALRSKHMRHYRYQVKGRDWLAEREHFALMEAYDALAKRHTARPFVGRGDVKLLGQYKFHLANRREEL